MTTGTLRLLPSKRHRGEVLEILRSVQGPVLATPGCRGFQVLEENGPDGAIVVLERWDSDASLTRHLRSGAYRRILAACELSGATPEFRFDQIAGSEGIERVERSLKPEG